MIMKIKRRRNIENYKVDPYALKLTQLESRESMPAGYIERVTKGWNIFD